MNLFVDRVSRSQSLLQHFLAGLLRTLLGLMFRPATRWLSLPAQRRWMDILAMSTLRARDVACHDADVAGVPCRHYQTLHANSTVLYLHGGGYVAGSPDSHKSITSYLAHFANVRVVVPDYRLAPEHPCPAAIDDALAVYQALLDDGVQPHTLTMAGDSAGGGLVMATLLAIKEKQLPLPASILLFSPWVDLTLGNLFETDREVMLSQAWLQNAANDYAGNQPERPECSPINGDLSGLPPVLIQVGSDEILLNDSLRLCEALNHAGSPARLQVHPQRWHDFQLHAGVLADADNALMTCARFIHQHRKDI